MLRVQSFLLLVASGLATTTSIANSQSSLGSLSLQQLNSAVNAVRNFKPKDQFTSAPSGDEYAGRDFQFDIPVSASGPNYRHCKGMASFGYDPKSQQLRIVYGDSDWSPEDFNKKPLFNLSCNQRDNREMRQNGFGARRVIEINEQRFNAVEGTNLPDALAWSSVTISMEGNEARTVTKAMRLRISGVITPRGDEHISCTGPRSNRSIAFPVEYVKDGCRIFARIHSITLVDMGRGIILRELFPTPVTAVGEQFTPPSQ